MTAIDAHNISIKYSEKFIIKHLSCSIPKGKITTIIGQNGCGKSTLLRSLNKLIPTHSGSIIINDESINRFSQTALAKKISFLPQGQENHHGVTVYELISYARYPYQNFWGHLAHKDKEMIEWAMTFTNIQHLKNVTIDCLSGGQRQKVFLALALAQDTEILLLDEPITYLDPRHQLEVLKLLNKLNKQTKKTILMVLHDINLASRFSDHLIAMKNGTIMFQGTSWEVINQTMLKEIFNIKGNIILNEITKRPVLLSYDI